MTPNSIHPNLTPSIISTGTKQDILTQKPVLFRTYAALHYAKRVFNKYEPTRAIVFCYTWKTHLLPICYIPGQHTVVTIHKYAVISTSASDFGFLPNTNITETPYPRLSHHTIVPSRGSKNIRTSRLTISRKWFFIPDPLKSIIRLVKKIKIFYSRLLPTISLSSINPTMTNYFPHQTRVHIFADTFEISAFINLSTFASQKFRLGSVSNAFYSKKNNSACNHQRSQKYDYKIGHDIHPEPELTYEQ